MDNWNCSISTDLIGLIIIFIILPRETVVSLLEDLQRPHGLDPGQSALGDLARAEGLDWMTTRAPFQT